jgi:hypothetical protein
VSPPSRGPSRECRHLFARGQCRFHERAERRAVPERVNFGGGSNPLLVKPAWVELAPRHRPVTPRRRRWLEALAGFVARSIRTLVVEQETFGSPWMASEGIAGGGLRLDALDPRLL